MPLRFFGASLLAHLFILCLFFWVWQKNNPPKAKSEPNGFVELHEIVARGEKPTQSVPPRGHGTHRARSRAEGSFRASQRTSSRRKGAHHRGNMVRRFSDLQKPFEPWNDFAPRSFEEEDENAPLRVSEGDSGSDRLKKVAVVLPHMHKFWSRVKEKIFYHDALLFKNIQGKVKVIVQVDRYGRLTYLNEASMEASHPLLRGWVAKGIIDALSEPILTRPMLRPLEMLMTFRFELFPQPPPLAEFVFDENRLHFDVLGYMPKSLPKPKVDKSTLTEEGVGLLSVTLPLYPMAQTRSQNPLEVDIFARLEMYKDACDKRNAEGGCYEAAKVYKKMNKMILAEEYFKKACEKGIEDACSPISSQSHEPNGSITPPSEVVR